ncbi:MAG: FecR domain-containing protein [Agarilytica sp.]
MSEKNKHIMPILAVFIFLVGAGVFYIFGSGKTVEDYSAYAEVMHVRGGAQKYASTGDLLSHLSIGDRLAAGDIVRTGNESSISILFADGSKLLLAENSRIVLQQMLYSEKENSAETVIQVNAGNAENRVAKQNGFGARYEVRTPAMQLAVRGTAFLVGYDEDGGKSRLSVLEGSVAANKKIPEVSADAGSESTGLSGEIIVNAGEGIVTAMDSELGSARNLLAGPALVDPPVKINNCVPFSLAWEEVEGAQAYKLQLLSRHNSEALLFEKLIEENQIAFESLADHDYLIRLRGVDEKGLEGNNTEHRFLLDARPSPPEVKEPLNAQSIESMKVKFRWSGINGASKFQFQVSDKEDFSNIISQVPDLPREMFGISLPLAPGEYYWRVASINEFGCQGSYSQVQRFRVAESKQS